MTGNPYDRDIIKFPEPKAEVKPSVPAKKVQLPLKRVPAKEG